MSPPPNRTNLTLKTVKSFYVTLVIHWVKNYCLVCNIVTIATIFSLALGYTTKIYFNACCKPSPLFDKQLVLHSLPLSLGPGYIHDTLQALLQLLLDLTIQPWTVLETIRDGSGPELRITGPNGKTITKHFPVPDKLSQYWSEIYYYCQLFQCCENFLSATPPSAPCLLCHPFGKYCTIY